MNDEPENEPYSARMDAAEMAAAELVKCAKNIPTEALAVPIVDQSCVWAVSVKKMAVREPDESDKRE